MHIVTVERIGLPHGVVAGQRADDGGGAGDVTHEGSAREDGGIEGLLDDSHRGWLNGWLSKGGNKREGEGESQAGRVFEESICRVGPGSSLSREDCVDRHTQYADYKHDPCTYTPLDLG